MAWHAEPTTHVPFEEEQLHEEAFAWESSEDFAASLQHQDAGQIRAALFEAFAPHLPPAQRGVARLLPVVSALQHACENSRDGGWRDALASVRDGDEMVNLRANPALALLQLLHWVYDGFQHVPGASVIVR